MEAFKALLQQGAVLPRGGDDRRRVLLYSAISAATVVVTLMVLQEEGGQQEHQQQEEEEHRVKRSRTARRQFDFRGACECIMRDHDLTRDKNSALLGQEFIRYFWFSRARVQILLDDFGRFSETNPFYNTFRVDRFGRVGASLEAKILLPLKTLAHASGSRGMQWKLLLA